MHVDIKENKTLYIYIGQEYTLLQHSLVNTDSKLSVTEDIPPVSDFTHSELWQFLILFNAHRIDKMIQKQCSLTKLELQKSQPC